MTLATAGQKAAALVAAAAVATLLGKLVLAWLEKWCEAAVAAEEAAGGATTTGPLRRLVGDMLVAAQRPAAVLLPFTTGFYSLTVFGALAEVAVEQQAQDAAMRFCSTQLLAALKTVVQALQDIYEMSLIVFVCWFALRLKDRLVAMAVQHVAAESNGSPGAEERLNLSRVLTPLSTLASWGIVCAGFLANLANFGVDVRPLMALGGAGTLAVGFAAQSTMSNLVAALSLYTTRPFVVGDRIQLLTTDGSVVAAGEVRSIQPMRTQIVQDNKLSIFINNAEVATLCVVNESHAAGDRVAHGQGELDLELTLRYQDVGRIQAITEQIAAYLTAHPDVDHASFYRCALTSFSESGPVLVIKAPLLPSAWTRWAAIQRRVLLDCERIVRKHGALLSINQDFDDTPPEEEADDLTQSLQQSNSAGTVAA